ncbi:Angiotensin-converting enzyme 2 [Bertholletia excelsa]
MHVDHHHFPCLHCHPQSYIRMVQHLIERCLLLRMNRDQCIKALAEHASVRPLVTLTVWRELMKENRDFFQAYFHAISPGPSISGRIQKKGGFARRKLSR